MHLDYLIDDFFWTPYHAIAAGLEKAKFSLYSFFARKEHPEAFYKRIENSSTRWDALKDERTVLPFSEQLHLLKSEKYRHGLKLMLRRKDIKPEYDQAFNTLCRLAGFPERHPFGNDIVLDVLEQHPELFDKTRIIKSPWTDLGIDIDEFTVSKGFLVEGKIRCIPKSIDGLSFDYDSVDAFFVIRKFKEWNDENKLKIEENVYLVVRNIDQFDIQSVMPAFREAFNGTSIASALEDFKTLEQKMVAVLGREKLVSKHGMANNGKRNAGL